MTRLVVRPAPGSPSIRTRLGLAAAIFAGLTAGALLAQDAPTAPPAPPASPPSAPAPSAPSDLETRFTEADRDADSVTAGKELISKVAEAYKKAPTISDTLKIEVITPMGPQNEELRIDMAQGNDLRIIVPQMKITSHNDRLYVEVDQFEDRFVGVPLKNGNVIETMGTIAEGFSLPLPHLEFRFGKTDADYLRGLSAASLEGVEVAGHRTAEDNSQEILLKGSNGTGVAKVNPSSSLLDSLIVDFRPEGAPPGLGVTVDFAFKPVVADALANPISFTPGDRKEVSSIEALMQKLQVGEAAPEFELRTEKGETVRLADLRGSVVVLDLWATWCGPCRKGLPLVNDFAKWAQESGKPVKVYGVNIWESGADAEEKEKKATEFWAKQGFVFPTLLDQNDSLANAYGPNGIPTTYVINQAGRIVQIHGGYDPNMTDALKKEVEALLAEGGATGG